jgi:hypothetical protein
VSATDPDQYTFDVSFDLQVLSSQTTEDIASAKPGQVNVSWSAATDGSMTVTNTTPGHTLKMPYEFTRSCIYNRGVRPGCPTLYGFYPADSPVCTVEHPDSGLPGFRLALGVQDPEFSPQGKWCAIAFAQAQFSQVDDDTVLPVSGAQSTTWQGLSASDALLHEADYSALASALAAKPKQWEIEAAAVGGAEKTTRQTPSGCEHRSYVIWSSTPLVCSKPS